MNAAKLNTQPYAPNIVRSIDSSPEGLDLAQPNTTIEILDEEEDDDEEDED
jgi:hypothetical protein